MINGLLRIRCACGWEVTGAEDEVVAATQEHGRRIHNMEASREQVLAMAVAMAVPPAADGARATPPDSDPTVR